MTLQEFFNQWNGKFAEFNNDAYPGQCKDLFSFYNRDVVGNPNYVPGDAWKLYLAAPEQYYEKVTNPRKGDVAIWQQSFGGYGHVAIVWENSQFFSQNYPLKTPCYLRTIPTEKILGYLRPLTQDTHMALVEKLFTLSPVNEDKRLILCTEGKDAGKLGLLSKDGTLRVVQNKNGITQALLGVLEKGVTSADWAILGSHEGAPLK